MKILLVQIRQNPKVLREEFESFLKHSGLKEQQLDSINVFEEDINKVNPSDYQGIFIGGASAANVLELEKYPFIKDLILFVKQLIHLNIPTFASCFGFQVATLALGGQVVNEPVDYEMGTVEILVDRNALNDLLFRDTPEKFMAVSVHQQKVVNTPDRCIELARTSECLHSFKVDGKRFWAFQFHPEVDLETLVARLKVYENKYASGEGLYSRVISEAVETPESNILVKKFIDRVISV